MESEEEYPDNKRSYRITVRFSKREYEAVKTLISTSGMSKVALIRDCVLQTKVKPRLTSDEILFMCQLVGMANNLNQLARSAHVKEEIALEAKALLFQMNWVIEKLK